MNVRVVIEYDPEVNAYSAHCPELPGCTSCGDTEEQALANIREAIDLYLQPTPGEVAPGAKVVELKL
jgi:predicted RNase H-like HicB family nuclease